MCFQHAQKANGALAHRRHSLRWQKSHDGLRAPVRTVMSIAQVYEKTPLAGSAARGVFVFGRCPVMGVVPNGAPRLTVSRHPWFFSGRLVYVNSARREAASGVRRGGVRR